MVSKAESVLQGAQKGGPARPQRVKAGDVPLGYVEDLSDARTPLADFFSTLLVQQRQPHGWRQAYGEA